MFFKSSLVSFLFVLLSLVTMPLPVFLVVVPMSADLANLRICLFTRSSLVFSDGIDLLGDLGVTLGFLILYLD